MARKIHVFDATLQKDLLSEFKRNSRIKSQQFSKFLANKTALITIIFGQYNKATKTKIEPLFLPFDKPNLCNDCIFMDQKYTDQLYYINQVDLNTNLFDNLILKKVVVRPTKKTRSVGPHKLKSKTTKKKEITPQKQRNSGV